MNVPIVTTLVGIITDVNDEQLKKAFCFIVVTLLGILTDASDEHSENASV
jgi:hypothetical protein